MNPSLWTPPPAAWCELRGWVDRAGSQWNASTREQSSGSVSGHRISSIGESENHLVWLEQQMAALEHDINDHIDRHPELKRDADLLRSIPGLGDTTVARVMAYAGDVRRFANAKALAAFIDVTPRQRLSGSSVKGRTVISRTGQADLHRALYMPGWWQDAITRC